MKQKSREEILSEIDILKQKKQLRRQERRYLAKLESKLNSQVEKPFNLNTRVIKPFTILVGIAVVFGIGWYLMSRPKLPPIDMAGHIEVNPPSHIMDKRIDEAIQKHMLEHADGKGKPGIIIQYNCTKAYDCEAGMVDRLKNLVKKYPENVYLAPGNYAGKIILTKLGERKILSSFDEKGIADFINGK